VLMYGELVLNKLRELAGLTGEDLRTRLKKHFSDEDFTLQDVAERRERIKRLFQELTLAYEKVNGVEVS
jgi:hypothetical protein